MFKVADRRILTIATITALLIGTIPLYVVLRLQSGQENTPSSVSVKAGTITTVNALGRVEPVGAITRVSASTATEGVRVAELRVKQGDWVRPGQVIAVLNSRDRLIASLSEAKRQVEVAQARLVRIQAEADVGQIEAQTALVNRLEAQLEGDVQVQNAAITGAEALWRNAQKEYERYRKLHADGAISQSLLDSKKLVVETAQQQLAQESASLSRLLRVGQEQITEARAKLKQLRRVLPADVQISRTEVESAIATVKRAEAELEFAYVRAPIDGQILTVHVRPGEQIGRSGIVELGQTQQMYVVAEVYETDVDKLRIGQQASITSEHGGFTGELRGTVDAIGLQIGNRNIQDTDPTARADVRVVEVKIRLTPGDSRAVAGLTNLKVRAAIKI